jgi:hypothetical protein
MRLLIHILIAAPLAAGVAELLGPGNRPASRARATERTDGTAQFQELVIYPAPGVNGFSRVQTWTTRREAGRLTRIRLSDRELQIPDPQRIARELPEFPLIAGAETRIVVLGNTPTEPVLRILNLAAGTVGRSIVLPAGARIPQLRANSNELWTAHSGVANQISITDLNTERVAANIQLRLNPQAQIIAFFFTANARTAYVVTRNTDTPNERGTILIIDVPTRAIRGQISLATNTPSAAVLAPDNNTIHIFGTSLNDLGVAEPSVVNVDILTGNVFVAATGLTQVPEHIAIHPNGTRIYFLQPQVTALDEYDTQTRRVVRRVNLPRGMNPNGIEISLDGAILSIRDTSGQQATYLDSESAELIDIQPIPIGPAAMLFRP